MNASFSVRAWKRASGEHWRTGVWGKLSLHRRLEARLEAIAAISKISFTEPRLYWRYTCIYRPGTKCIPVRYFQESGVVTQGLRLARNAEIMTQNDSTIWLVCAVGCKLPKSYMDQAYFRVRLIGVAPRSFAKIRSQNSRFIDTCFVHQVH